MSDYKNILRWKIQKYGQMYPRSERMMAFRLGIWSLRFAFSRFRKIKLPSGNDPLKIGFAFSGGLGDFLIANNYFWYFERYLGDVSKQLEFFVEPGKKNLAWELLGIHAGDDTSLPNHCGYDFFVSIRRFPAIEWVNKKRIAQHAPKLLELVNCYEEFARKRLAIFAPFSCGDVTANQHSVCEGKIRIQQPDIGGLLGIGTDYAASIRLPSDEDAVLARLGLPERFITLNRGVDAANRSPNNTKMWPLEYYNRLIEMIKTRFPDLTIVQLGVSVDRSPMMTGMDISLVGKTSLDELKVILKRSQLHIDGEGGMVHLRHALNGGKSVVLFGPTSRSLYGYPENLNLRSDLCSWCEWVHDEWNGVCLKTGKEAACMKALTPEMVFESMALEKI